MIRKISDKDKEDWENFSKNKQKTPNKNFVQKQDIRSEKTIEILDKDKHDWENFIKNKEKVPNKDFTIKRNTRHEKIKTVYDTWVFSKDIKSINPNWLLIDTIT